MSSSCAAFLLILNTFLSFITPVVLAAFLSIIIIAASIATTCSTHTFASRLSSRTTIAFICTIILQRTPFFMLLVTVFTTCLSVRDTAVSPFTVLLSRRTAFLIRSYTSSLSVTPCVIFMDTTLSCFFTFVCPCAPVEVFFATVLFLRNAT